MLQEDAGQSAGQVVQEARVRLTRLAGRLSLTHVVVIIDGAAHVGGATHGGGVGDCCMLPVSCRSRVPRARGGPLPLFGGGVADSVA